MRVLHFILILITITAISGCKKEDSEPTEPKGWFMATTRIHNYKIGADNLNAFHGLQSGYIESITDTTSGYGTLMQYSSGDNFKGKRVMMTGYIALVGPDTAAAAMWIRVDDFDKRVRADFDNMYDRHITGNTYWTKCIIIFDVPESTCVINYGLLLYGYGKAWLDNVSFEVAGNPISKTAYYLNIPLPDSYQIPKDLPAEPVNLDFEE
jgi:hypothetical protein